jgi:predicted lipoprotein with Yx(FWY)xxD motif/uncharacterized protein (DUF736 family)
MDRKYRIVYFCLSMLAGVAMLLSACFPLQGILHSNPTTVPTSAMNMSSNPVNGSIPVTGSGPIVVVNDQTYDGEYVVVAKVVSKGPGWIAIHNQQNGQVGPVIGYTQVLDGENDNVQVKIDPSQATPVMSAILHTDGGVVGKFEFPGPDVPVIENGLMINPTFKATVSSQPRGVPAVAVKDQDVSGGKVLVDEVVSKGPGWVVVYIDKSDGTIGDAIGYTAVKDGTTKNISIFINPSKATPVLHVMLHIDAGQPSIFESNGPDTFVMVNGQMVGASFNNTARSGSPQAAAETPMVMDTPASGAQPTAPMVMANPNSPVKDKVQVSDQLMQNGMVKVDDVVSDGPGWIVIYTVKSDQPDQPIGWTHVNSGDNQNVMVKVDASKATTTLYAQLHVDAGNIGVFEFPGPDAPVMLGVRMISGMFSTTKDETMSSSGAQPTSSALQPSIQVEDQPLHDGVIVVSQALSIGDMWLVIHPQNKDGSIGDMVGYTLLHDGVNKNVLVHIDTTRTTQVLVGMLHLDASKAAVPQFPGADSPVMVNGQMVVPPFHIIGPLGGDVPLTVAKDSSGVSHLADNWGLSLYTSLSDSPGKSSCDSVCLKTWRPLLASGAIKAGDGVTLNKVGVLVLPDRSRQVTYAGLPLYYNNADQNPGDTKGQGTDGQWFLATP